MSAALALSCASARAEEADSLSAKATDPTASLMSFQLNDWYTAKLHDADGTVNQVVLRAAIPLSFAGSNHIFRVTQPFVTSSPGASGATDTTLFDLAVFDMPWGRLGAGLVGVLPTGASGLSSEKWSLGPALGFMNTSHRQAGYSFGLFMQSYFSVAGEARAQEVGVINLQPIFSQQLGAGKSLSLGSSQLVYDSAKSRWASLQLGVNYGQVVSAFGHKWRPNIEAGYDFRSLIGNPAWTIRAGVTLLLPTE